MSEYQYYEFQAIDRPLTKDEMAELRALSTRATITPTRFVNVYNYGDFRGDPLRLMERYFDAFVYVANWGTNRFMLRLPRRVLAPETAERYCVADGTAVHVKGEHVILEFVSEDEEGGRWIEDEDAEGRLPALIPLRADLAGGDRRSLYLAWLACACSGALEDEEREPPVPPGLGSLSASLKALADFLRIDEHLIAVAAERSAALPVGPAVGDFEQWIRALPTSEKDDLLLRLAQGDEPHLRAELLLRFRAAHALESPDSVGEARTVAELLARAKERAEARRRSEAAREAKEEARRAREQAAARAVYLDDLAGREEDLWRRVEALVETKEQKNYDQAVQLLVDLRDLANRKKTTEEFKVRLSELTAPHAKKPSFISRLDRAGLPRG